VAGDTAGIYSEDVEMTNVQIIGAGDAQERKKYRLALSVINSAIEEHKMDGGQWAIGLLNNGSDTDLGLEIAFRLDYGGRFVSSKKKNIVTTSRQEWQREVARVADVMRRDVSEV